MICDCSRAQQEEEETRPLRSHGLFVYYSPPSFLFLCKKCSLSLAVWGCARGSPWLKTLYCNPLLIWKKQSLLEKYLVVCFRLTFWWLVRGIRKPALNGSRAGVQTGSTHIWTHHFSLIFLSGFKFWMDIFLLYLSSCLPCICYPPGFIRYLFKSLYICLGPCSVCQHSFST